MKFINNSVSKCDLYLGMTDMFFKISIIVIDKVGMLNPFRMLVNGVHQQISAYFHRSDIQPLFRNIKPHLFEVGF